ncbi:MAG: DUF2889 domain-containing protein [Bacillota bacterium]
MLGFSRTKWVGVERPDRETFFAHGVLEDNIYGMELDVWVKAPEFVITGIEGKMRRVTTPVCEQAIPVLKNALGLAITAPDLISAVNRKVGREGCRHFANLLLECCDAVLRCAFFEGWSERKRKGAAINPDTYLQEQIKNFPDLKNSCYTLSNAGEQSERSQSKKNDH